MGGEWISYRQNPTDPQSLSEHFGGIVRTGPAESQESAKASVRAFRYSGDLGVFFHATCAPRVRLSEQIAGNLGNLFVAALVADTKSNPEKCTNHDPAGDTQVELEPQQTTIQKAETAMDETVNLDWQRFSKLTEARSRFAKTSCVYIQADSRACPIRVGKAAEGLEARYRGGTGYAIDAAMHEFWQSRVRRGCRARSLRMCRGRAHLAGKTVPQVQQPGQDHRPLASGAPLTFRNTADPERVRDQGDWGMKATLAAAPDRTLALPSAWGVRS